MQFYYDIEAELQGSCLSSDTVQARVFLSPAFRDQPRIQNTRDVVIQSFWSEGFAVEEDGSFIRYRFNLDGPNALPTELVAAGGKVSMVMETQDGKFWRGQFAVDGAAKSGIRRLQGFLEPVLTKKCLSKQQPPSEDEMCDWVAVSFLVQFPAVAVDLEQHAQAPLVSIGDDDLRDYTVDEEASSHYSEDSKVHSSEDLTFHSNASSRRPLFRFHANDGNVTQLEATEERIVRHRNYVDFEDILEQQMLQEQKHKEDALETRNAIDRKLLKTSQEIAIVESRSRSCQLDESGPLIPHRRSHDEEVEIQDNYGSIPVVQETESQLLLLGEQGPGVVVENKNRSSMCDCTKSCILF
eukprot:TRINITY_DN6756_c0_g1_i1.p2 TRINITY_DN6756_c0_g1~~TRINITY_DN6756_c0_g1_i1.p2  ORF type:complete len:354 (+),score=91.59 TRINITY_DN6756_c0_g1_i1:1742-2803(+)